MDGLITDGYYVNDTDNFITAFNYSNAKKKKIFFLAASPPIDRVVLSLKNKNSCDNDSIHAICHATCDFNKILYFLNYVPLFLVYLKTYRSPFTRAEKKSLK